MIKNYIRTAWRVIVRHKSFSLVNIFGLAMSMAVCFLILLLIADQRGYDQFHQNKDRIYRIQTVGKKGNNVRVASSALPLAEALKNNFTGIEAAASLVRNIGGDLYYNDKVASGGGYFADGNLFKVMDFTLQEGNASDALEKPFSLVISPDIAAQLFPRQNPIGKMVKFVNTGLNPGGPETGNRETNYGQFMITGLLKPNPGKTTLPFKLLASLSTLPGLARDSALTYHPNDWSNVWSNYTFVLLQKGRSKADLQRDLNIISEKHYPKGGGNPFVFEAAALTQLMPADPIGNPTNISMPKTILVILGVLCLIVMLSACLNYTNLSVARLLTRAKEVGVRKVSGASRTQIFTQFIGEAVLVSLLSLIGAFGILIFFQELFAGLWLNRFLHITFQYTPSLFLEFVGFSVAVGIIAGLLPAMYISFFNPVHILKGVGNLKFFRRLTLRKMLLVVQLCISLIFVISTSLIYLQGDHLLHLDYGFDKDNIVNIKLYRTENYDRFAHAISGYPGIAAVSACTFPPATGSNNGALVRKAGESKDSIQANYIDIDAGCLDVWGLKLIAGRNLPAVPGDSADHAILINEKMVRDFRYGSVNQAVGQHVLLGDKDAEIIGVVKDFQFLDPDRSMEPLLLRNRKAEFGYITVRLQGKDLAGTVAFLRDTWKEVNPFSRFEYEFFDQQLLVTHSMMSDTARIIGLLAALAVVISCLGLLGMATYAAETRRKEVAVRKVLGSGVGRIVILLSKGFFGLLVLSIFIAVPVACLINNMWLRFFASRISITPWVLLFNILLMGLLCLGIVFSQAWKVSRVNPAGSLKAE